MRPARAFRGRVTSVRINHISEPRAWLVENEAMIIVNVMLVLDVEPAEVADAAKEILLEQQAHYSPTSCLIDYAVGSVATVVESGRATYVEGDAFARI